MKEMTKELAMAIAVRLFPHVDAQTRHAGSFLSPSIRWAAKIKLESIAQEVLDASE